MIKKLLTVLFTVCILLSFSGCKTEEETEEIARGDGILAKFSATDFDGNLVNSSIFAEYKVTLVNVWATWCEPCKDELPALGELNAEYDDFQVIGIAYDTTDRNYNKDYDTFLKAKQIVADAGATYRHLLPANSLKSFLQPIQTLPTTIFVDSEGYQIGATYVGSKSKSEWKKIIDQMLTFINSN